MPPVRRTARELVGLTALLATVLCACVATLAEHELSGPLRAVILVMPFAMLGVFALTTIENAKDVPVVLVLGALGLAALSLSAGQIEHMLYASGAAQLLLWPRLFSRLHRLHTLPLARSRAASMMATLIALAFVLIAKDSDISPNLTRDIVLGLSVISTLAASLSRFALLLLPLGCLVCLIAVAAGSGLVPPGADALQKTALLAYMVAATLIIVGASLEGAFDPNS